MPGRPMTPDELATELDRIDTAIEAAMERRDRLRAEAEDNLEAIRARVAEVLDDPDSTEVEMQTAGPTDGENERVSRLQRGAKNAEDEIDELRAEHRDLVRRHQADLEAESRRDEVRRSALASPYRESGDGATALARSGSSSVIAPRATSSTRKAPTLMSRGTPLSYAGARLWDWNGQIPTSGDVLRSNARRVLEVLDEDDDVPTDANSLARIDEIVARSSREADDVGVWLLAASNPDWYTAFWKSLRDPTNAHLGFTERERRAANAANIARAAMSLTDANGGLLVPQTLDPTVILTNSGITDPIRSISTVKTIATNDWSGATSAGVNAEWLGEGSEAADASPTFVQPVITPKKGAAWLFGSHEMLADSGFAEDLPRLMADGKARLEGAALATGNVGATRPRGVVAAVAAVTASIVTSAATSAFAKGDVYNTADALRPRDASKASWIANKKIYSQVRQFDTSGGSAFWANMGMGLPSMLLGQPQYECSTMGSVITTGANVLLVGNFEAFYVIDRLGSQMYYEPLVKGASARPTGQAGWYFYFRTGSDVVDADAFRLLQLSTTAAFTALG